MSKKSEKFPLVEKRTPPPRPAAQIATFPLGLLYFHQFPNYFILSNLVVIPLSSLVLVYGIFVFIAGKIAAIAAFSAKLFSWLVFGLNKSVLVMEKLPGALMEGISISGAETVVIYLLLIFVLAFVYHKQFRYLVFSLCSFIFLLSSQAMEAHTVQKQRAFIVYNIPALSAYDFISGINTVFLADSALLHAPDKMKFHILNNRWDRNIIRQAEIQNRDSVLFSNEAVCMRNGMILFAGKRIAVIRSAPGAELKNKLKVDRIILSKNPKMKIEDLKRQFEFGKIIVDSSNSRWKSEKWKKECETARIDFYSVIDSGAYIEEL